MEVIRQILSLVTVFSLLAFALWKLRRFRPAIRSNGRALQSIERLTLTPQHTLHVIQLNGAELVIATHPQGCTLLDTKHVAPASAYESQLKAKAAQA